MMMERIVYACKINEYLHPRYHTKQENRQLLNRACFVAVKGAFGDVFLLAQACPDICLFIIFYFLSSKDIISRALLCSLIVCLRL